MCVCFCNNTIKITLTCSESVDSNKVVRRQGRMYLQCIVFPNLFFSCNQSGSVLFSVGDLYKFLFRVSLSTSVTCPTWRHFLSPSNIFSRCFPLLQHMTNPTEQRLTCLPMADHSFKLFTFFFFFLYFVMIDLCKNGVNDCLNFLSQSWL